MTAINSGKSNYQEQKSNFKIQIGMMLSLKGNQNDKNTHFDGKSFKIQILTLDK